MEIISTIPELEARYDAASARSLAKEAERLTPEYQALIESSPFFALATIGPGGMDCSPRGDQAPSVTIVDDTTIHIPDRKGNNRLDSLRNIVEDGRVALLFLIPGLDICLRINGRAQLAVDEALLERHVVDGTPPRSVIVVTIERVYFQCARAIRRAKLWDASAQQDPSELPTAGDILAAMKAPGVESAAAYNQDFEDNAKLY